MRFPCPVSWKGRTYEAANDQELSTLLTFLGNGRMALANRYRVSEGPSRWRQAMARRIRPNLEMVTISADIWTAVGAALVDQMHEIRRLKAELAAVSNMSVRP